MIESAVRAWRRLRLTEPVRSGNRNEVWTGELGGEQVAVRTSRRRPESLAWEFDVLARAADADVGVAAPIPADDGRRSVDGIVVQPWINGREPDTLDDWALVAETLARVHAVQVRQRPGCCAVTELAMRRRSVDADLDVLPADVADLVIGVFAKYS
jgi:Ser/Thr protein kinase RdoA (MazF antagonist)